MRQRLSSARKSGRAAKAFSRRTLLKCGLATGALALGGCQTTSPGGRGKPRQLNIAIWRSFLPAGLQADFTRDTGIEISTSAYRDNVELLTLIRTTDDSAFDLICPSSYHAPLWRTQKLLQPIDTAKIGGDRILAPLMAESRKHWTWDGDLYLLPVMWGTEALAWRSDIWSPDPAQLSYGDLWLPEMKGKVQVRPHSMMMGLGLYLDRIGQLPSNRMLDSFRDPGEMARIWGEITEFAMDHRFWINQFWDDDWGQQYGFTDGGCVIGQTWHDPIVSLQESGQPLAYMAPREGALAWMDGLSIPAGARNLEEVYVFLDYLYRPEVGGRLASSSGFYAAQTGAADFMAATDREAYRKSLPGDALERLWFWPPTPEWYRRKRTDFVDRYLERVGGYPEPA